MTDKMFYLALYRNYTGLDVHENMHINIMVNKIGLTGQGKQVKISNLEKETRESETMRTEIRRFIGHKLGIRYHSRV